MINTRIKKVAEYREKSIAELTSILHKKLRFQFQLRLTRSQESFKSHFLHEVRKDIAKLKTLIVEKRGDK